MTSQLFPEYFLFVIFVDSSQPKSKMKKYFGDENRSI